MRGMVPLVVSLLLIGGIAALPGASALPACGNSATFTLDDAYHLQVAGIRQKVWQETNGLGGLQTASCTKHNVTYPADTFVAQGVPQDLGILGICATVSVASQCF